MLGEYKRYNEIPCAGDKTLRLKIGGDNALYNNRSRLHHYIIKTLRTGYITRGRDALARGNAFHLFSF